MADAAGMDFYSLAAHAADAQSPTFFFDPRMSSLPELADLSPNLHSVFRRMSLRHSGACSVLIVWWTRVASSYPIRQCTGSPVQLFEPRGDGSPPQSLADPAGRRILRHL